MALELFKGTLLEISKVADLSKTISAKELLAKRREFKIRGRNTYPIIYYENQTIVNPNRANSWTRDGNLYTLKEGKPYFHINQNKNLVFENIEEAYLQLTKTGKYVPSKENIEKFLSYQDTFSFDLSKLDFKETDDMEACFFIDDADKGELKRLRETVFSDEDTKVLKNQRIFFHVSSPKYLRKNIKDKHSGICQVSLLGMEGMYDNCSNYGFCATNNTRLDSKWGLLIGVLRGEEESAHENQVPLEDIISVIDNPHYERKEMKEKITAMYKK